MFLCLSLIPLDMLSGCYTNRSVYRWSTSCYVMMANWCKTEWLTNSHWLFVTRLVFVIMAGCFQAGLLVLVLLAIFRLTEMAVGLAGYFLDMVFSAAGCLKWLSGDSSQLWSGCQINVWLVPRHQETGLCATLPPSPAHCKTEDKLYFL